MYNDSREESEKNKKDVGNSLITNIFKFITISIIIIIIIIIITIINAKIKMATQR